MSKPVVVTIPHQLGRAEARRRIEEGLGRLTGQFAAMGRTEYAWDGDVMRFAVAAIGQEVTGTIAIADQDVTLNVMLPGFLAMLANKVKGQIQREGQVLLEDKRR